ncbi:F-box/kelch-repeat protein SKIP6 [Raphanus sativus]|uniref:F-box/kelch-repeat protein SKIP6 n=1 Tax=Raphanus sativus TaxID=3726 RepID=A0A6J0KVN6_RAPSA|nr:F-box/kelch-repeat protein SKIP6 [Raphanus sativus]KAJ4880143.1 F-box/kelch-repeat protein SKIP6 [Raphanus sativus]
MSRPAAKDTIVLRCFPLVLRSDHAASSSSQVPKRYHSLLASQELNKTRLLLGRTKEKERLYVCLSTTPKSTPSWFLLRPETTGKKTLIPVPSLPSQPQTFSSYVPLDWGIYVIGGFKDGDVRSSDVSLLDCRTNTWREVPSMSVGRAAAAAGAVDGKIYVFGGCEEVKESNWAEVYDPKTETWEAFAPLPDCSEGDNVVRETLVMDEKVYGVDFWSGNFLSYSPCEGKWGRKKTEEVKSYYCVVEKVLYGCDEVGNVFWRESEEVVWKEVKGLEALQEVFSGSNSVRSSAFRERVRKLSSFGLNIVVFWVGHKGDVWCAEISLERREEEEGEIWGRIQWSEDLAAFRNTFRRPTVEVLYAAAVNV